MNRSNNAGNSEFDYVCTIVVMLNQNPRVFNVWPCLNNNIFGLWSVNSIK